MAIYPKKVELRAFEPRYAATSSDATVFGRSASFECGCYASFSLVIESDRIAASFASNGCGYMVACADVLAETISGKNVADLHGLNRDELRTEIAATVDAMPHEREHCLELCFDAVTNAFTALRTRRIEESRGEEALICTCFGISESVIEQFIAVNPQASVEAVANSCRAGTGCGSCRMLIQEMIDSV